MGLLEACPPRKCSKLEARKISFLLEIWGGEGGEGVKGDKLKSSKPSRLQHPCALL